MGTKKQKKKILKRKRARKAVKALGRRRESQVVDWLYEGYNEHYNPEINYQFYNEEYDREIVGRVYGRCKSKGLNISYSDLETFYNARRKRFKKRQALQQRKRLERQCIRVVWLGTADAHAMNFYNTCFAIRNNKQTLLVDSGGGQTIMRQLDKAQIGYNDIHDIFITHKHLDHLLGLFVWLRELRTRLADGKYKGDLNIYASQEVIDAIRQICSLLNEKLVPYFDDRIHFIELKDGDKLEIIGQEFTFFDTHSQETFHPGFTMKTKDGVTFAFLSDVPLVDEELPYVKGVDYLVHEAACLNADKRLFRPGLRGHSTLQEACENFKKTGARYLIVTHTEDHLNDKRSSHYRHEAATNHHTMIMVPDDLETTFLRKIGNGKKKYDDEHFQEIQEVENPAIERKRRLDSAIETVMQEGLMPEEKTIRLDLDTEDKANE